MLLVRQQPLPPCPERWAKFPRLVVPPIQRVLLPRHRLRTCGELDRRLNPFPRYNVTTFTPSVFTFSTVVAAASFATSTTPGTTQTLDLTTKFGAFLLCQIGRNAATALTRAGYFAIRRSFNSSATIRHPANNYDFISSIAAVNATTVASGGAAGATTVVLASGTGMVAGQVLCANLTGSRIEFFQIDNLTTATVTIDDSNGFKITHNASDVVTNGADCGTVWLPGGDIWNITPVNNSGQTLIMAAYAEVYASDTGT